MATRELIVEHFWWPGEASDVTKYVETCDACQRMQTPRHYKTFMSVTQSSLLKMFSIDLAGLSSVGVRVI